MSHSWLRFAIPFFRWTLNTSDFFIILDVTGHISVEGCGILFSKLVWTTTTGLVFPDSVPIRGLKSASQISYCLISIIDLFKIF